MTPPGLSCNTVVARERCFAAPSDTQPPRCRGVYRPDTDAGAHPPLNSADVVVACSGPVLLDALFTIGSEIAATLVSRANALPAGAGVAH